MRGHAGGYHFEMKGISNRAKKEYLSRLGGYHLEMKGISNGLYDGSRLVGGGYHLEMKGISNLWLVIQDHKLVVIILK